MSRVPPHASGGNDLSKAAELEQLEELGDDAIIAHQQGAHAPVPRAQVTEESRSVVISDHPPVGSEPPASPAVPAEKGSKRRTERTEKTVVIRDRRQLDELRREMAKRKPKPKPSAAVPGIGLWVVVGVAAFVVGGLVALFATREEQAPVAPLPSIELPSASLAPPPPATVEPPKVSIDELPVEGSKK